MAGTRTHYEILNVPLTASEEQIRAAYHKRLLELHPDKRGGDVGGVAELEAVRVAFQTLGDKSKRALYDARTYEPATVVVDTLTEDDFDRVDDELTYPCRCGGSFFLAVSSLGAVDIVPCDTCSLAVRIR